MSNYKNNDNQGQLQRQLSPTHVWAIALGALVIIVMSQVDKSDKCEQL